MDQGPCKVQYALYHHQANLVRSAKIKSDPFQRMTSWVQHIWSVFYVVLCVVTWSTFFCLNCLNFKLRWGLLIVKSRVFSIVLFLFALYVTMCQVHCVYCLPSTHPTFSFHTNFLPLHSALRHSVTLVCEIVYSGWAVVLWRTLRSGIHFPAKVGQNWKW